MEGYQRQDGESPEAHAARLLRALEARGEEPTVWSLEEPRAEGGGLEEAEAMLAAKLGHQKLKIVEGFMRWWPKRKREEYVEQMVLSYFGDNSC